MIRMIAHLDSSGLVAFYNRPVLALAAADSVRPALEVATAVAAVMMMVMMMMMMPKAILWLL